MMRHATSTTVVEVRPTKCPNGHRIGHRNVLVQRLPCSCAEPANGRVMKPGLPSGVVVDLDRPRPRSANAGVGRPDLNSGIEIRLRWRWCRGHERRSRHHPIGSRCADLASTTFVVVDGGRPNHRVFSSSKYPVGVMLAVRGPRWFSKGRDAPIRA